MRNVLLTAALLGLVACDKEDEPLEHEPDADKIDEVHKGDDDVDDVADGATPSPPPTPANTDNMGDAMLMVTNLDLDGPLYDTCKIGRSTKTYFEYDSSKVTGEGQMMLDNLAACLTTGDLKDKRLELVGHTDSAGSDEYNKKLGMSRAESIKKYLEQKGVDPARIEINSKGEAGSEVNAATAAADRNVRIKVREG